MKISLVGYMGSGKTTVGKQLAELMGLGFIDLDEFIEVREGKSIQEIFSEKGEIYFRKLENELLKEVLSEKSFVLSTGGGTPSFYNNMDLINKNSLSFYLHASPTALAERLNQGQVERPLIAHVASEDLVEFIAKHLFERNAFYQMAHESIATSNRSEEEVVSAIHDKIKTHQNLS